MWYGSCTAQDRKDLARVVRTAQGIVGCLLPDLDTVYAGRVQRRARRIATDPTHPANRLFVPLPSGRRFRALRARTKRLKDSFYLRAVKASPPADRFTHCSTQGPATSISLVTALCLHYLHNVLALFAQLQFLHNF